MNKQPTAIDDQIAEDDLETLTLEELEELFMKTSTTLEQIFYTMSSYAQKGTPIEAERLAVIGLENQFKNGWPYLKAILAATIYYAIFPEEDDQQQKKKATKTCHTMTDKK